MLLNDTWSQYGHLVSIIYMYSMLHITKSDINPQVNWTISLVSADGHFNIPQGLYGPQTSKTMLQYISFFKSQMAEWLEQASQWNEMYCHDLEVMSSNPSWVELGVRSTSVLSHTWTKHMYGLTYSLYHPWGLNLFGIVQMANTSVTKS